MVYATEDPIKNKEDQEHLLKAYNVNVDVRSSAASPLGSSIPFSWPPVRAAWSHWPSEAPSSSAPAPPAPPAASDAAPCASDGPRDAARIGPASADSRRSEWLIGGGGGERDGDPHPSKVG